MSIFIHILYKVCYFFESAGNGEFQYTTKTMVLSKWSDFQAKKNGETYCYKKPKFVSQQSNILKIMVRYPLLSPFVIEYTFIPQQEIFQYKKVKHNPLDYLEAEKCLYPLLKQLYSVCDVKPE